MRSRFVIPCLFLVLSFIPLSSLSASVPDVRVIDEKGVDSLVQNTTDRVVIINMWATWCVPCIEEFPEILRLRREYMDKGVAVFFVSLDDPKKRQSQVVPFLKRMNVDFPTYIKKAGKDEQFINALSSDWSGALPATFIYDRNGMLSDMRIEQVTYEELEAAVLPLVKSER